MTKAKPRRAAGRKPPQRARRKMPAFTKPPTALVEVFERAVGDMPDVQPRRMFGYPAAFTNTQMFACLFQDNMIVRLSEQDRAGLAREGVRRFEPMPGRPMREYVVVPQRVLDSPSTLHEWLGKAHGYAASLPPKKQR